MTNDLLYEAATHFFDELYQISIVGDSSGYSNGRLARVTDKRGQWWCLRQWVDTTEEMMRFIHQVLTHSRAQGFAGVPMLAHTQTGESLLPLGDAWFEAQAWIAGGPAYRLEAHDADQRTPNTAWRFTTEERHAVIRALADFHASTETLPFPLRQQPCQVQIQQSLAPEMIPISQGLENNAIIAHWLSLLPVVIAYFQGRATDHTPMLEQEGVICHNDLWPDHVYFIDGIVSGFVDFGALTFTSPAVDLAQLILHFGGWQTREEVLTAYTVYRPLSVQDEAILPIVAASDLVSEGCWSIGQLCTDELSRRETTAHWHNLHFLLPSLAALAEGLS